ncbi:MAG TPA: flagellar basal body P-ring formation chaperone FlgA [Steroidobacteraceae bacterium]
MEHALLIRAFALASIVLVCVARSAHAGEAAPALEPHLREQRPDVLRWQWRPLSESANAVPEAGIAGVGRVGSRTAVRFTDGRVRWYAVVGMSQVLVSAHALDRGAAFTADDAELAEHDVIALGCEPAKPLDAGQRWRATRRLVAGEALCAKDIEIVPDVERDRPVTLNAQRGAVSASRVLTAAADARFGERVRLRDRTNGITVSAIVTGPGAARLSEEQE